jgi:hypothetical protein
MNMQRDFGKADCIFSLFQESPRYDEMVMNTRDIESMDDFSSEMSYDRQ